MESSKEKTGGMIIPPPEVRTIIEKTAGYVARNGPSFEQRIKTKESKSSKFGFLLDEDPYNGYYQKILDDIKQGKFQGESAKNDSKKTNSTDQHGADLEQASDRARAAVENVQPLRFLLDRKSMKISPLDLKVIKLVAQFVAVNGESFIKELNKKRSNSVEMSAQLGFLDTKHSMHGIYEFYLAGYKEILERDEHIMQDITSFNQTEFLDRCYLRAEHNKKLDMEKQSKTEANERERKYYASIDWDDFSVVETVEFTDLDEVAELAVPLNRNELQFRSLVQKQASSMIEEAPPDYEEAERKPVNINANHSNKPHPKPRRPVPKGMKILSAGKSRLQAEQSRQSNGQVDPETGEKLLKCPLTGKLIPESKFAKHISILLMDPRYKDEKRRYESKFKYGSNLTSREVYENIQAMVEDDKRDSKTEKKVIWNGVQGSISATKRKANRQRDYDEEKRQKRARLDRQRQIGPHRR